MISDSQTNIVYLAEGLNKYSVFQPLTEALQSAGVEFDVLKAENEWCRDYMPVQVEKENFILFKHDDQYGEGIATHKYGKVFEENYSGTCTTSDLMLDGGNVVKHKDKVIITRKVLIDNEGSEADIRKELERLFRAQVILIPLEPGDEIGHADGMVRFIDEHTVILNDYSKSDYETGFISDLEIVLKNAGLEIKYLPHFYTEEEGHDRLPSATGYYINFLHIGNNIFLPQFNFRDYENYDADAAERIREVFGIEPVPIPCYELAKKGGGILNCVSWTVMS